MGRWQTGGGGLMLRVTFCLSLTHAAYLCIVADLMYPFMAAGDGPLSAGEFYHHQIIVFKILQIFHILLEMGASKAS